MNVNQVIYMIKQLEGEKEKLNLPNKTEHSNIIDEQLKTSVIIKQR